MQGNYTAQPVACADGIQLSSGAVTVAMWYYVDPAMWAWLDTAGQYSSDQRALFSLQTDTCYSALKIAGTVKQPQPSQSLFGFAEVRDTNQGAGVAASVTVPLPGGGSYGISPAYANTGWPRGAAALTPGAWSHIALTMDVSGMFGISLNGKSVGQSFQVGYSPSL